MMHLLAVAGQSAAVIPAASPSGDGVIPTLIILLAAISLLPFLLTMLTSFAKLVIVGGIVRQAVGTPHIPPMIVVTGLALILSIHIMAPVGITVYNDYDASTRIAAAMNARAAQVQQRWNEIRTAAEADPKDVSSEEIAAIKAVPTIETLLAGATPGARHARARLAADAAFASLTPAGAKASAPDLNFTLLRTAVEGPVDEFLVRHSARKNLELFQRLSGKLLAAQGLDEKAMPPALAKLAIHAPAFVLTELTEAFLIGFLIFVPFLVIDLVVSNILLALGMPMLSPTMVSLPLKLLVFVMMDGWGLIFRGLVLGYA